MEPLSSADNSLFLKGTFEIVDMIYASQSDVNNHTDGNTDT